ncbi:MAG: hypothetical protein IKA36_05120 [Clostridia bacterium]|nr:hypothetical protein [Clostridia bacterium]
MASVSETNTETTLQLYANPLLIQDKQLALFEEHVFDGKRVLDGNNVFTFGLEMGATLAAGIVNEMANNFQTLYPSRAQTMSDLYRHLSDYDYVDMFSTPATTTIELMFERNFLIDNAPIDGNEDGALKVIIPEFSTFTIGNHIFGIHYPIEIKIRKAYKSDGVTVDYDKCMFHCIWNTETVNPLYRLTTNILEHRMFTKSGLNFLCISIPIQQFKIDIKKEDSVSSTGFIRRYTYSDRFYAIRVFHYWNNQWVEMAETLSDVIYNPQVLTAKVKVLSDIHTVEVSIPQSYFTEGIVGNRIMCMLYTTEGALDVDIRNYNTNQFSASFLIDDTVIDDTYSAFLKRIPMLQVIPLASRIANGSNGKTFEDMKNRVMNSVGGDDLIVTPKQLEAHLVDTGFKVSRYIDNITDRIYIASKEITDSNKDVVGSGEFMTTISAEIMNGADGEYETVKKISDTAYLIMPTSIFKYDVTSDSMLLLSRYDKKKMFEELSTESLINELNTGTYTFTPFHVKLETSNDKPTAGTFDLLNPTVTGVSFVDENKYTSTQVSMYGSVLLHDQKGTNGYKLTIALYKTDDLKSVQVQKGLTNQLAVILRTNSIDGTPIYMRGKYIGVNSDGRDLVEFHITTNYKITSKDDIDTTSFTLLNDLAIEPNTNYVNLTQDYELLFFASSSLDSFKGNTDAVTESNAQSDIPREIRAENMVWLATQKMTVKLGEAISSVRNNVFMTLTGKTYKTYNTTEFATYAADVYMRYENDITNEDGVIIHNAGELIVDETTNKLIIRKHAGDLIITSSDSNILGARNPSCKISSVRTDTSGNNISSTEMLFLDSDHLSKIAEPSNNWYPARTFKDTDEKWKVIYTGATDRACVIESKDLLKYMIDTVRENNVDLIVGFPNDKKRTTRLNTMTNKYELGNPIPGSFIYVNNVMSDTSIPRYWVYKNTDGVYVLDKVNKRDICIQLANASAESDDDKTATCGALYWRDPEYSEFDYTPYITEADLCDMFNRITALEESGETSFDYLMTEYNLDRVVFNNILRFRDPWIKIIEAKGDTKNNTWDKENPAILPNGLVDIIDYWDSRSYMNFDSTLSIKTQGVGIATSVTGLEALAYLQERSTNKNTIKEFATIADATEYLKTESEYRMVWIDNYVATDDSNAVSTVPLVNDLDINEAEGEHTGALLWCTHLGDEKHHIVVKGPSLIKCYNSIMNCKTSSGYIYELKVYDASNIRTYNYEDTTFKLVNNISETTELEAYQKFNAILDELPVRETYVSIVSEELAFLDVIWTNNWPWEMDNWFVNEHTTTSYIGKSIEAIGMSISLDKDNKDAKILHYNGDIILDEYGSPAPEQDDVRNAIYHVSMTHCDYKLTQSNDVEYKMFREDIEQLLRGYFDLLESTRPLLLERTNLYYTPIKSMGYGQFKGANGEIMTLPLEVTINLRIHIAPSTAGSTDSKDLIKSNIIQLIEKHMSSGNISCTILAEQIRQAMSDSVLYVDVLGINGDHNIQTLVSADPSQSSVRLRSILVVREDNTIGVEKDVNIEWSIMQ